MTALGLASYSIFLWHDPILRELRNHDLTFSGTSGFFVSAFFLLALTASASALTYLYVERPALRRKTARRSGPLLGSSGALAEARIRVR
jgi:peptidoglycan/LPS O-acetylase OafA/YrhL